MPVDHIRYDLLAQEALRGLVRGVLVDAARKGLPGEHHFFISFDTRADGVRISARLREQYPDEMTIVLQHQFWDLKVGEEIFEVGLSFNGVPEKLVVPFAAIKSFVDPSVQFALQFERVTETQDNVPRSSANAEKEAKPRRTLARPEPKEARENKEAKDTKDYNKDGKETKRGAAGAPRVSAEASLPGLKEAKAIPAPSPTATASDKPDKPKRSGGAEVVRLDRFRKK